MSVKLLTEQHLKFLSLKGGCTGSSESTLVKMQHCWKSHVAAQMHFFASAAVSDRNVKSVFRVESYLLSVSMNLVKVNYIYHAIEGNGIP